MEKVPFILVTGFLGSGKTTLLKRLLDSVDESKKIAVIQNEFAEANVDARELAGVGRPFTMLEMNRGSVFCVCLLADFTTSCAAMIDERRPDLVVLEATGLADPIAIIQILGAPPLGDRVYLMHSYCIVDAAAFLKMEKAVTRMQHQVRIADTIIVNKIDKVDDAALAAIDCRIRELNPFAEIRPARYCEIPLLLSPRDPVETVARRRTGEHASLPSAGRPPIATAAVRSTRRIPEPALRTFLNLFERDAYRIKGFANLTDGSTVSIQSVLGSTEIKPVSNYTGPTELVALAPVLDSAEFTRSFEAACR
jgi:G3E family GTPase